MALDRKQRVYFYATWGNCHDVQLSYLVAGKPASRQAGRQAGRHYFFMYHTHACFLMSKDSELHNCTKPKWLPLCMWTMQEDLAILCAS